VVECGACDTRWQAPHYAESVREERGKGIPMMSVGGGMDC
jgi:hypothetical protein